MGIESIVAFTGAMLVLAASPGPGVFATVAQALSGGFRSALDVIAGIVLGDLVFLLLAVCGLAAVARVMGEFFLIVKMAGAAYLIWLGFRMWCSRPEPVHIERLKSPRSGGKRFLGGLLITLGNPKVILFYVGFLPTFIDLGRLGAADVAVTAAIVASVLTAVMGFYAYWASRMRRLFTSPRAARNLNRGAGTVMIGAGVAIATR